MTDAVRPTVHVVIVNWNAGDHLRECLSSIERASQDEVEVSRVTVVDNASTDGSSDRLHETSLPLEIVRNDRNRGFAAACNQGTRGSESDYILFLNPDARLLPETLSVVTRFMESDAAVDIGICGARMLASHGSAVSCSRFPSIRIFFGAMTGLNALHPTLFPRHHLREEEIASSRVVDQVIGAFYFVRGGLFAELGGFDERYFVYYEDVDFALRARLRGAKSYFLRDAEVFHAENVSSDQVPAERLFYSLRSRLLFAKRHWAPWRAAVLVALTLSIELTARIVASARRGDATAARATLGSYRRLLGWLLSGIASTQASPSGSSGD